jgi:hypothetical protein
MPTFTRPNVLAAPNEELSVFYCTLTGGRPIRLLRRSRTSVISQCAAQLRELLQSAKRPARHSVSDGGEDESHDLYI